MCEGGTRAVIISSIMIILLVRVSIVSARSTRDTTMVPVSHLSLETSSFHLAGIFNHVNMPTREKTGDLEHRN